MKTPDSQSLMFALRAWLDEGESGQNADRLVRFVYEKALSGHFGYFKLVIDLVDGKLRPTAEEELIFEADCVLVVPDEGLDVERRGELTEAA
jgi:hypothetical protein